MAHAHEPDVSDILARWREHGRSGLLPCLIEAQERHGWLSPALCAQIGRALRVPLADVYGVASFYSLLYTEPVGRYVVRLCDDVTCYGHGSAPLADVCRAALGVEPGQTSPDGLVTFELHPCLGYCERAPCLMINAHVYGPLGAQGAQELLGRLRAGEPLPHTAHADPAPPPAFSLEGEGMLLARVGRVDPSSLADYEAHGGYLGLREALRRTPAQVVEAVKASGLTGRGGAAFPTGIKWESAARQPAEPKYVVCNADESEPGTFKDRLLMEADPFAVLEGMTIAAYAVGASRGYIYVRGEFHAAHRRLAGAVAAAREAGYLGERILGTDFTFDVELRRGAGAYVCGEETALFESIEGKRGMPRQKPPFPTEQGLFGRPTVINNVETLANVPLILARGPAWFRSTGPQQAPGPKLFCLSGAVARPGVYEATMNVALRELVERAIPREEIRAVLVGGAAGTFLAPDQLDTPATPDGLSTVGAALGSGALIVVGGSADMLAVVERITRFFAHESCGKCYPCQLGTYRQWEIVRRWQGGRRRPDDVERLHDVAHAMREASICGLGQTAANALLSALAWLNGPEKPEGTHGSAGDGDH